MTYCGRFAPSPTGPLHFGSLVAALGSYCDARAAKGRWLVRIEDVDEPRTRQGAAAAILHTLELYGFEWDGTVVDQSSRTARYEAALARLAARGDVYACVCSRRELAHARLGAGGEPVYPGTCRDMGHDERDAPVAWRLRVDREGDAAITFVDRLQGLQSQSLGRDVGDFAVRRRDGLFAYQLAVVVDDAEQGVTDVVRGADLLASTARQIYLQRRLGCATPRYLHLPVAINAAGEKLSKQTRARALPANALPALLAAWRFLEQPTPDEPWPDSVPAFWAWALHAWTPARLPPVRMLPAPARF